MPGQPVQASPAPPQESPARRPLTASARQYGATYAASFLLVACGLLAYRVAASSFDDLEFAQYALTRRLITLMLPAMLIGAAVGIPKLVARERTSAQPGSTGVSYLFAGLIVTAAGMVVWTTAAALFPQSLAALCLGDANSAPLIVSLIPMLLGLLLNSCCTSYCHGRVWILAAQGLQILNLGIVPITVLVFAEDAAQFFTVTGAVMTANCLVVLLVLFQREGEWPPALSRSDLQKLVRFGLPRVPGDLAYYGLLVAPALIASHQYGIRQGGDVAYALSVVTLLQQIVYPLGYLLLPMASSLLEAGQVRQLVRQLVLIVAAAMATTLAAVIAFEFFAFEVIRLNLGEASPELVSTVRWMLPAAIPMNLFMCVRSVIDAAEHRPLAPRACVVGLGVLAASALIPFPAAWGALPVLVGFNLAAATMAAIVVVATFLTLRSQARIGNKQAEPQTPPSRFGPAAA